MTILRKDPSLRKVNRRDKSQRPEMTILTRSDIRNMANVRLKPFGLDMKTKSISGMVMKRALGRIQDSRNLMQNVCIHMELLYSINYCH